MFFSYKEKKINSHVCFMILCVVVLCVVVELRRLCWFWDCEKKEGRIFHLQEVVR